MRRKRILYHSYDKDIGEHYYSDEGQIQFTPDENKIELLRFRPGRFYQIKDCNVWVFVKNKVKVPVDRENEFPRTAYRGDTVINVVLFTFTDDDFNFVATDAIITPDGDLYDAHNIYIQYDSSSLDRYLECDQIGFRELIETLFSNGLTTRLSHDSLHI